LEENQYGGTESNQACAADPYPERGQDRDEKQKGELTGTIAHVQDDTGYYVMGSQTLGVPDEAIRTGQCTRALAV